MIRNNVKEKDKKDLEFQKKEKISNQKESLELEEINLNMISKISIKLINLDICAKLDSKRLASAMECQLIPLLYNTIKIHLEINKSLVMNNKN